MDEEKLNSVLLSIARTLREIEFQLENQYKALRFMLNTIDDINNKINRTLNG